MILDLQSITHYSLHLVAPVFLAMLFFRTHWKRAYLIMLLSMLVDLDHVWATPMFDPDRCSIGFHPLHSYPAMGIYVCLLFFPKSRALAMGLLFHMMTDYLDCLWMES